MGIIAFTGTDTIRLTLSAAVDVHIHTSVVIRSAITPWGVEGVIRDNTILNVTTPTTICAAPGTNKDGNLEYLSVCNVHATLPVTVLIEHLGDATVRLKNISLLAGESLYWSGSAWFVEDAGGGVKSSVGPGRYLGDTVLTTGTSFVTGPETRKIRIRMVGGGAGGGGCTSIAAAAAGAGGGGAGGYAEKVFSVLPNTAYAYAIGAAGAGVSGAAGANGGNTTFTGPGAVVVTAFGGTGGPQAVAATTLTARAGGAGGVISTNGDINSGGEPGDYGVVLIVATPIVASGAGGPSPLGSGGLGIVAVGNGNNALGFGGGGGGSATGASAVRTGGNGTAGCIIVEEYA